jgi:hypothetical protein
MTPAYVRTVATLIDVAPAVFANDVFAMKGGTALNLFLHDMPRLSVDIDVVFLPASLKRDEALGVISEQLALVRSSVERLGYTAVMAGTPEGEHSKLFIRASDAEVKVEVNHVFRGAVLPIERRPLVPSAQRLFASEIELPMLAPPELYASKLVAALDRQHPRDLFDVMLMNESGTDWSDERLLDCFVVYLAGHNRPIHEVLFPRPKALQSSFDHEFVGMSSRVVAVDELEEVRAMMLAELPRALLPHHREFLVSVSRAQFDGSLLPYPHIEQLPALQWKLLNMARLKRNKSKFEFQQSELERRFRAL